MTRTRRTEWFRPDALGRRPGRRPTPIWRAHSHWTALALAGLVLAGGCGKKAPTASAPPPTTPAPEAAAAQPAAQPDLPELNRSLMRWMMGHRRAPKDFEDFAATAGVTIQPPPAGKKYVIRKDMHIVLVDR